MEYKSVKNRGTSEYIDRRSKFLGFSIPVKTEEEAREYIEKKKKEFHDARHVVFAYRIGRENDHEILRYTDDGEPQGTAGMPMVEVIRGDEFNVTDLVVVVVRYFGGTLLGTGGLVKAYGQTARGAIENAGVITYKEYYETEVRVHYTLSGSVEYNVREKEEIIIKDIEYTEDVTYHLLVPKEIKEEFTEGIADLTSGQGEVTYKDLVWSS